MTDVALLDPALPLCQLGEGAFWDAKSASLYWVDILGRRIYAYEPGSGKHRSWKTSKDVSFVFPADGRMIIGLADGVYHFNPETGDETLVAHLDLPADHRLNDGKLDPQGRLWVGTINTASSPSETAALYVLRDDRLEEVEGGYENANGKAWSPDGRLMYHADTARCTIWQYDYDLDTGTVSNKRVFAKMHDGHPDGLSCGPDGNVIAAVYGGSRLDIFSYRGDIIGTVELPVPNVTSCTLGGADGSTLYITTAYDGMNDKARSVAPLSGQIFATQ